MTELTYDRLMNSGLRLYRAHEYDKAYALVTENAGKVGGSEAQILNFRFCLAGVGGHPDLALEILKSGVAKGLWWSENILMEDDDLADLRNRKEFLELVELCKAREKREKEAARPVCRIIEADGSVRGKRPFVVALHGNSESSLLSEPHWRPCLSSGFSLALVQSSLTKFSGGYSWDDPTKGCRELERHWSDLVLRGMDQGRTVLGGFSAGGRVVMHAILNNKVDPLGAILVGPWIPDLDELTPLMSRELLKDKRFHVIVGDQDADCLECSKGLANALKENGATVQLHIEPGVDHEFPDWFEGRLPTILSRMLA